jgi:hypothetical protein
MTHNKFCIALWVSGLLITAPLVLAQSAPRPLGPGDPVPWDNCNSTCGNYVGVPGWELLYESDPEAFSCCVQKRIKPCERKRRQYYNPSVGYRWCCTSKSNCGSPGANCEPYDWVCPGG